MLLRRYHKSIVKEEPKENIEEKQVLNYAEMSNEQLKELLDAKGIEYKSRANKTELIDLLQGAV